MPTLPDTSHGPHRAASPHYHPGKITADIAAAFGEAADVINNNVGKWNGEQADLKSLNADLDLNTYLNAMFVGATEGTKYPAAWYMKNAAGSKLVSNGWGNYLMDPRKTGSYTEDAQVFTTYKALVVHRALRDGEDGVLLDMCGPAPMLASYLKPVTGTGTAIPFNTATGRDFTIAEYLALPYAVCDAVRAAGVYVSANGLERGEHFDQIGTSGIGTKAVLAHCDQGWAEIVFRFPSTGSTAFPTEASWLKNVQMMIDTQTIHSKPIHVTTKYWRTAAQDGLTQTQWEALVLQWRRLHICSVLMGDRGACFTEFSRLEAEQSWLETDALYGLDLGAPLNSPALATSAKKNGVYQRRYDNALLIVNPTAAAVSLTASPDGRVYVDIAGNAISYPNSIRANTGRVWLVSGTAPPVDPPPPPPPEPASFDEEWDVDTTTPFGFDSVHTSVGSTQEVIALAAAPPATPAGSGIGIRTVGGSATSSPAVSQHNTYPFQKYEGIGATWKQLQPVSYDAYVTPPWFDIAFDDAKADALHGNPYTMGVRIFAGADSPVGPSGPAWMIGGAKAANNNKPVEVVNLAQTDAGATAAENVPVPWDLNYQYHYERLLAWLEAYLHPTDPSGLTVAGTRRSDYVMWVSVALATEAGTEMPLSYGTHTLVPASGSLTVNGRTYTSTSQGYLDTINKQSWAKHVPSTIVSQGQAAIDTWLRGKYQDGWDWSIQKHMDVLSVDSSVAWGGIFSDGYKAATALVKKYVPLYGRSKLWSMSTNLRINPPRNADGTLNWSAPKDQWSYANWSKLITDFHKLIISLVPAGSLPKVGFQTAGSSNAQGGYGLPPEDFTYAVEDAIANYGAMFVETYSGVFSSSVYGPGNITYTKTTGQPGLAANAALVDIDTSGSDNVFHAALGAAPVGNVYGSFSFADTADAYYLLRIDQYALPTASEIFRSLTSGADGVLTFVLGPTGVPSIEWDGVEMWSDTTLHIARYDEVEIHHILDGATSGFELRINGNQVAQSLALAASVGVAATAFEAGVISQRQGDVKFGRIAMSPNAFLIGTTPPPSDPPPALTVDPLPLSTTQSTLVASVTATSANGVASVGARVNDGPLQLLTNQLADPSRWSGTINLIGTAGQTVQDTVTFEATDASAAALTSTVEASLAVLLPFDLSTGGSVAFTKTLYLGTGQFAAMNDRFMTLGHFVEGVAPDVNTDNAGDVNGALLVSQSGTNGVTVAPGWAVVQGDDTDFQGPYADFNAADDTFTQSAGAPSGGNKRVDLIVAYINDSEHTTRTPADLMQFGFVTGTEAAGASLTEKSTWPDLPPSSLPLALAYWDSSGIQDLLDVRRAYGPALWGEDGNRYRLGVTTDGLLGMEQIQAWPDWVATA